MFGGGFFHGFNQLVDDLLAFAFEKQHRMMHVFFIGGFGDVTDTGTRAALNLVLQARSRAVSEIAVFALANFEGAL